MKGSGDKPKNRDHADDKPRKSRSKSRGGGDNNRRDRGRKKERREYDTPFDDKGRCHYHKNVQLAAKKQFGGGWKVLCAACPKCMEEKHADGSGDDKSVRSGRSAKSATKSVAAACAASVSGGDHASGKSSGGGGSKSFDKNGCCKFHTHIQVAKKSFLGGGWKVVRTCPACEGDDVDADDYSVKSGRSAKSTSSRKSTRSGKGTKEKAKRGKATQSGRYGALPFDGDGYCCRHPNVQLAQKKMMGGFKIIHDVCPECEAEDGGGKSGSGKSRSGKGSRNHRSQSRSRRSSHRHVDNDSASSEGGAAECETSTKKKKRIRVKNLKTEDEYGNHGRYSGYVNDEHQPHGNGTMRYDNGDEWEGVWSEGSQVHGKMKKSGEGKKQSSKTKF